MNQDSAARDQKYKLHLGLAEQGKLYALNGEHTTALRYYREAMRMAVHHDAPPVFARHYLECALESLEMLEAFDEVLAYCAQAIQHYQENKPNHVLAQRDLAFIYQRKGVILLKCSQVDGARQALEAALARYSSHSGTLTLAQRLLDWINRGLYITAERILQEQNQLYYFSVRPDTVNGKIAIRLP